MPTRRQLIQKISLNASAATVTFSNIPQNYTDLQLLVSARSDYSGDYGSWATLNPNGDTANVTGRVLYNSASAGLSATYASGNAGYVWINSSLQTANTFANSAVYIPNYCSSVNKTWSVYAVQESNGAAQSSIITASFLWNSTAAITSITLDPQSTSNFAANSTFYLYGITQVPIIRGGTVTIPGDGFKYHTFTSTSTLQVIERGDVECLVLAGGGAGGPRDGGDLTRGGGGGGAGGFLSTKQNLSPQTYSISVGGGGALNSNGTNSTAFGLTAIGGGRGGTGLSYAGANGGSGGGGAAGGSGSGYYNPGSGTAGQGNSGGGGPTGGGLGGGGGGGAGAVGGTQAATAYNGGPGGAGLLWKNNITYYAGGGGGGAGGSTTPGVGGIGGGGSGSLTNLVDGTSGTVNTGGGGGGGGTNGGLGGSGIVIIRYPYDGN